MEKVKTGQRYLYNNTYDLNVIEIAGKGDCCSEEYKFRIIQTIHGDSYKKRKLYTVHINNASNDITYLKNQNKPKPLSDWFVDKVLNAK